MPRNARQWLGLLTMSALALHVPVSPAQVDAPMRVRQCATPEPNALEVMRATELARPFQNQSAYFRVERVKFVIPVAFHVIHAGGVGNVPELMLDRQIAVLNQKLGPFGYRFVKHSVSRTDNSGWHRMISGEQTEVAAKHQLGIDHSTILNLYVAKPRYWDRDSAGNPVLLEALGVATFPWWLADSSIDAALDGVVIDYESLPGAATSQFDLGYTAVHEVGHWIGLLHTFHGGGALASEPRDGCEPPGDEVPDTPYEHQAYLGPGPGNACPANMPSSCPAGGVNPTQNYMDYADDRCMSELTPGQDLRGRNMMQQFRPSFVATSPDVLRFNQLRQGGERLK